MEKNIKRGKNFTEFEKQLLIDICSNYKNIIENKKTDGTSVKEKTKAWEEIRDIYSASSETGPRNIKQLHALYDTLKKKVRKDNHNDRVSTFYVTEHNLFYSVLLSQLQIFQVVVILLNL